MCLQVDFLCPVLKSAAAWKVRNRCEHGEWSAAVEMMVVWSLSPKCRRAVWNSMRQCGEEEEDEGSQSVCNQLWPLVTSGPVQNLGRRLLIHRTDNDFTLASLISANHRRLIELCVCVCHDVLKCMFSVYICKFLSVFVCEHDLQRCVCVCEGPVNWSISDEATAQRRSWAWHLNA